ncbi:MAG: RidA family protein [Armatimonadota bacterium]
MPMALNRTLGYSQAVRVGNLLFVSGQVAVNEDGETVGVDDARAQVEQIYKNLRAEVEAGGSEFGLIAKMTIYATSLDYLAATREVRHQVFGPLGRYPASTFLVISSLAKPEYLVEIEAIAMVKDAAPNRPARARVASRARAAKPITARVRTGRRPRSARGPQPTRNPRTIRRSK